MEAEWKHRVGEGRMAAGAWKNAWKRRKVTTEAKMSMYNGIIVPSVLYGTETGDKYRAEKEGGCF